MDKKEQVKLIVRRIQELKRIIEKKNLYQPKNRVAMTYMQNVELLRHLQPNHPLAGLSWPGD